jgi:hypothetical protein
MLNLHSYLHWAGLTLELISIAKYFCFI